MKANEAPERLYLSKNIYSTFLYQVPDPDDETAVEYTRTDAFIKKAREWLRTNLSNYFDDTRETASDWVTIAAAKRKLNPNTVWNNENVIPKYNLNGITDFIVSSAYGHVEGVAHTYTPKQWSAHLGFNANRDFRWAYEKDLIDFD